MSGEIASKKRPMAETAPSRKRSESAAAGKHALLVIDVQNDFMPGGSLAVARAGEIVAPLKALLDDDSYDVRVATLDWHPPGHCSFASSHAGRAVHDEVVLADGTHQHLWPDHCVQGTRGAELHASLDGARFEHRVRKGQARDVDSYSGFADNAGGAQTELHELLQAAGVTRVTLTGLALDVCVRATALDAARLGYDTCVDLAACRAAVPDDEPRVCAELRAAGVQLLHSTASSTAAQNDSSSNKSKDSGKSNENANSDDGKSNDDGKSTDAKSNDNGKSNDK